MLAEITNRSEFVSACEFIADEVGVELIDTYEDDGDEVFEDDGVLHIVRFGARAAFDVSDCQQLSQRKQNHNTREILKYLQITCTDRALA